MKIKIETWFALIGTLVAGCAALASYAFSTFETKDHAKETKIDLNATISEMKVDTKERLQAIQHSLDKLDRTLRR